MQTVAAKPPRTGGGHLDAFSWAVVAAVVATFALLVAGSFASAKGPDRSALAESPATLAIASPRP